MKRPNKYRAMFNRRRYRHFNNSIGLPFALLELPEDLRNNTSYSYFSLKCKMNINVRPETTRQLQKIKVGSVNTHVWALNDNRYSHVGLRYDVDKKCIPKNSTDFAEGGIFI